MMKKIFILLLLIMTYFIGFIEGESLRAEEVIERPVRQVPFFFLREPTNIVYGVIGEEFTRTPDLPASLRVTPPTRPSNIIFPVPDKGIIHFCGYRRINNDHSLGCVTYNRNVGTWIHSASPSLNLGGSSDASRIITLLNERNGEIFLGFAPATNLFVHRAFNLNEPPISYATSLPPIEGLTASQSRSVAIEISGLQARTTSFLHNRSYQFGGTLSGQRYIFYVDAGMIRSITIPTDDPYIAGSNNARLASHNNEVIVLFATGSSTLTGGIELLESGEGVVTLTNSFVPSSVIENVKLFSFSDDLFFITDFSGNLRIFNRNFLFIEEIFLSEKEINFIQYIDGSVYFTEDNGSFKRYVLSTGIIEDLNIGLQLENVMSVGSEVRIFEEEAQKISLEFNVELGNIQGLSPNGFYFEGDEVSLRANPRLGYRFVSWSGDVFSINRNLNITMPSADLNIQANFEPIPQGEVIPEESLTSRMFSFIDSSDLAPMFVFSMVAIFVIALVFLLGGSFTTALTVGMAILGFFVSIGLLPIWTILAVFIFLLVLLINVFRGGK